MEEKRKRPGYHVIYDKAPKKAVSITVLIAIYKEMAYNGLISSEDRIKSQIY